MKNSKYIIIISLLLVSSLVSWNLFVKVKLEDDKVNIHLFPKSLNGWLSQELTITEDEYAILETKNAFARKYTSPKGQEVMLFVVYSEHNRKVSHPPEVCYTGNGLTIVGKTLEKIETTGSQLAKDGILANKLILEQKDMRQFSYYWFKVGDTFTPNYWKQQILIAIKTLFNKPSSSALIRVSADIGEDESVSQRDIEEFSNIIIPDLQKYLP